MTATRLAAVDGFEQPPISYSDSRPENPISELNDRLARGDAKLVFDRSMGSLRSMLDLLRVPISSQTLVFSKTSLQQRHITPRNPRAIYFNDEVYVGFVRGGDVLELSVADPHLGTVFYTLDQQFHERPTPSSRRRRSNRGWRSIEKPREELRRRFWEKMKGVLRESEPAGRFPRLSPAERSVICDILVATKPEAAHDLGVPGGRP